MTFTLEPPAVRAAEPVQAPVVEVAAVPPAIIVVPPFPAPAAEVTAPRPARLRPVLTPRAARLTGLATFAMFVAGVAVEPAATGPDPVLPWWADALSTGVLVLLFASWIALGAGRRSGLRTGLAAGLGLITMTVLCPLTDHHVLAAWWYGQLAVGVATTALLSRMLTRTRRR